MRQAEEVMNSLTYMASSNKQDVLAKDLKARFDVFARMLGNQPQQQFQQQEQPQEQQ
jgi:hypothetical protein